MSKNTRQNWEVNIVEIFPSQFCVLFLKIVCDPRCFFSNVCFILHLVKFSAGTGSHTIMWIDENGQEPEGKKLISKIQLVYTANNTRIHARSHSTKPLDSGSIYCAIRIRAMTTCYRMRFSWFTIPWFRTI